MATAEMGRRRFLALAAGGAVTLSGVAAVGAAEPSARDDPWQAAFEEARTRQPWLAGYDSAPLAGYGPLTLPLPKGWPTFLTGTLYRNGPALHTFGGTRYHHWFDGDGMVQRFHIADGHLTFTSRYVRTEKLTREIAAGRRLWPTFGSAINGPAVTHPDALNPANISVLWHNRRLFALWEAGSPHELDPETLVTSGRVAWDGDSYLPFTAHPKIDASGALWGIGYANIGPNRLILYHLDRHGQPRQRRILAVPQMPPVHDFVLTEDYLVIPLPPFAFERAADGAAYLDHHRWDGQRPTRILIVNRADFTQTRMVEGAPWWAFHYGGGWQDRDGTIHLLAITYPDTAILSGPLRVLTRGKESRRRSTDGMPTRVSIDRGGRVTTWPIGAAGVEFPSGVTPGNGRFRQTFMLTGAAEKRPQFTGVGRVDPDRGVLDNFRFDGKVAVEEHLFIPGPAGGWLIGVILDLARRKTVLTLFKAADLAAGPVAQVPLPMALPLGLHGTWVAHPKG